MNQARWAHKVWEYAIYKDHNTRWRKRTRALSYRHNIPVQSLAEPDGEREEYGRTDDKAVRRLVQEEERRRWRDGMARKSSLRRYSSHKESIRKGNMYDNTRGSGLLFQARARTLGTRTWRAKFTEDLDTRCAICGSDSETIDHIVVACRGLTPHPETDSVPEALGFTMAVEVDEGLSHPAADRQKTKAAEGAIERTKRRLEHWWRKNRE
ncbi:hypothetical protein HPB47_022285 [Ixodes persulcatus]|uniref:Uncharacterized protein n=1 Tax=Ixodes persulcatus TaxID=34615 RepID=A0AC60QA59_IXOPE|nr:hypothetical protein HPB47_022285 [Ixodes persulcatus]